MNNPIKIIHKFNNNNRRNQYIVYIFIGSVVDDEINDILNSISKKSLYETLDYLSKNKVDKLVNFYDEYWYRFLFNKYHIEDQNNMILKSPNKKKTIISKFGKDWFTKHFEVYTTKRTEYSFASNYYDYLIARNKIKTKTRKHEVDFTTYEQTGGNDDEEFIKEDNIDEKIEDEDMEDTKIETIEDLDDEVVEDFDIDELTKLYSMEEVESDKNIKETAKLISEATKDKSWLKESDLTEVEFNEKLEDIQYDSKLEDVYEKVYIRDQYIFIDDTIQNMRNKIAVSIPISEKFGENIKLLPEYQYFWSEYNLKNQVDRVMIGQKLVRRNELLKIDIKPNSNLAVYENLRNNLGYLRESFGIKIKREDDENNIIRDYDEFMTFNEIYMLDIMNELGINYDSEADKKKNLYEVYVNIYFPLLTFERFEQIVDLLKNTNTIELDKNEHSFSIIKNDIKLEKEIYTIVEETRTKSDKYTDLFNNNYVLQTIIHVNLYNPKNLTGTVSDEKFDLYKIFDSFIVSNEYPFIQYQTPDSQLTYKFYTKTKKIDDQNILSKWFDNAPYGISFKIKITDDKYISINLNENGRIEYKITWKEEDKATIDDVKESYKYVNNILLKINNENKKIKIILPDESKFKYAFINTIQKFSLPDKFRINHNDLSDFSRFFFPYIALVIEPKKRVALKKKEIEFSKYGTYLRYKRISNYENKTRMHLRMLYFMRNYEISDKELINEVSKQFNITMQDAATELDIVRTKYGKVLSKIKRNLKKLKAMPKSKPPGIGIDILGRSTDRYKIRITGARSKKQLEEIESFIKILIYIYTETYLKKNTKYQKLKDTLSKLNKIAKRRNKVREVVMFESTTTTVKEVTSLDKKRLGFKPEEGQNQWTRSCQNSGDDKKRRPLIVSNDDIKTLIKRNYKFNSETNYYEKTVVLQEKGKKKEITVRAIKLPDDNGQFNYFTCDPDENKEHVYIGFLSKSNNPSDLCMPCCFKKDQLISANKKKKNYYLKCIGQQAKDEVVEQAATDLGDKVYILQDTNKIQEGRFIFLPKYLNKFFNEIIKNDHIIKNHYMIESNSGYFFKFTVKDNYYHFLAAMANVYNTTIDNIKNLCINKINSDNKEILFTFLNNGDIKSLFKTRDDYTDYIKNSNYLEYDIMGELLALPGVISKNGILYFILEKKIKIIKKNLEKDTFKENYYIKCLNYENNYQFTQDRDYVFLIKDGKYYFPIYNVRKNKKLDKKIFLQKNFTKGDENIDKVINELFVYYNNSCLDNFINNTIHISNIYAKELTKKLSDMKINIKEQVIDERNKVKYLLLDNNLLVPTKPSGTSVEYNITNINKLNTNKILDLSNTIKLLKSLNTKVNLDYIPMVIYYNKFNPSKTTSTYNITSLLLKNKLIVPVHNELMNAKQFKKYGLSYEFQSLEEQIDYEINNKTELKDERDERVKNRLYRNEGYNLFRLELSLYLNNNHEIKKQIISIVRNENINNKNKRKELQYIIVNIINKKLMNKIKGGGTRESVFELINKLPSLKDYHILNIRDYCKIHKTKDTCNENLHCIFNNNTCKFQLNENYAIEYIHRIIDEMIQDKIKFKELVQEDTYYVSDIVDYTQYSNRPNQKIIKTTNFNIKKIMGELFGKNSIPQLGRRRINKSNTQIEENYPELIELGNQLIQEIVSNNNSIIRAYVNSYYWLNNQLYDIESRNLGYLSELQDKITNLFKANIIDYIQNNVHHTNFAKDIMDYIETQKTEGNFFVTAINKFRKNNNNTDGILELIVLSYLIYYPIVVYDNYNNVKYIFSNGLVKINDKTIKKYLDKSDQNKTIYLKFDYEGINTIPRKIYSIYYKV